MAEITKDRRPQGAKFDLGRRMDDGDDSIVEVHLKPEVLEQVEAAAKASGQTTGDWLRSAVSEAISKRI